MAKAANGGAQTSRARDLLHDELTRKLERAHSIGRSRRMRVYPGVDFSSNDYLGLAARFRATGSAEPFEEDPLQTGELAGSTGSRLLSGESAAWSALEDALQAWHASAREECRVPLSEQGEAVELAALYFPSGYVANEGLLSTLITRADWVASDEWNHGSLIDGVRLSKAERHVYAHQDLEALENALAQVPEGRRRFVVTESVFGMDGDLTDLPRLVEICEAHDALLIVDEAHATGVYGPRGQGRVAEFGLQDRVLATVHTCGKALGSHGAYVISSRTICDWLVQSCRHFIFTTALPPRLARLTLRAIEELARDPEPRHRLLERAAALAERLRAGGVPVPESARSHIVPILLGSDERAVAWAERLQELGLRVPAIRFPTVPQGQARLRISLRADHQDVELDRLIEGLISLASQS
jgi:8-amino-7-oxononanoate synthase